MDLSPLSSGGNIAGQLSSSTNYTIDGMTAKGTVASGTTSGAYTISMEAVREFEVVTNQYDVTNGRSGGGTVSAVTNQEPILSPEVYSDSVVPIGYPAPMIYGEINRLPTSLPINMVSLWEARS